MPMSSSTQLPRKNVDEVVIQRLFSKWTIELITELLDGPKRPCQLYKALPGISSKVLNQRLKSLRDSGIIIQEKHSKKKLHTEYRLSELGQNFRLVLDEIEKFVDLMKKENCVENQCPSTNISPMQLVDKKSDYQI